MSSLVATQMRKRPLLAFFVLACAISWLVWAPLWLPALGFEGLAAWQYQHALGAIGPIAAAFLVSYFETGRTGPTDLLRRMGRWRACLPWLAVALFAPYLLLALTVIGTALWNDAPISLAGLGNSREFPQFSALVFFAYNLLTFGFGEEAGWRGFALPRLQTSHSAWLATLVLTLGWAFWHLPLFLYRPGYTSMGAAGVAGWLFSLLTGALLLTWLYNESRGSILVVAVFHAAVDVAFTSGIATPEVVNATGALVTVWGVIVLFVAGPEYLSYRKRIATLENRR